MFDNVTVGVEIEIPGAHPDITNHINRVSGIQFRHSDDGSIRVPIHKIDDTPILPLGKKGFLPTATDQQRPYGLELVSPPVEYTQWRKVSPVIADILSHIPTRSDQNASIHVHMDASNMPWITVKNFVRWFYSLEAMIYRVSALGITHRGVVNDYKFARPLSAPICWMDDGDPEPVIDMTALFTSQTATEFMKAWGRMDLMWGEMPHYCPHRLHGINVVPLQTIGTIELRVFNGNYTMLPFIIDFSMALYKLAMTRNVEEYPHVHLLGSAPQIEDDHYSTLLGIDMAKIFRMTRWQKGIQHRDMYHHYGFSTPNTGSRQRRVFTTCGGGSRVGDDDDYTDTYVYFRR